MCTSQIWKVFICHEYSIPFKAIRSDFFLLKDFSFFTGPGAMNKVAAMSVKRGGVMLRMPRV